MAGPITRDRFICTDCNDTAPGKSGLGTSVGRMADNAGPLSALRIAVKLNRSRVGGQTDHDRDGERQNSGDPH